MRWLRLSVIAIAFGSAGAALAAEQTGDKAGTQVELQFAKDKYKFGYLLYLPEGYGKDDKKWPLIMFLHGAGESGSDLKVVKKHGPPKIAEKKNLPFIVVSPQSPGMGWQVEGLNQLLDDVMAKYKCDPDRVYLTGLSMGGGGTGILRRLMRTGSPQLCLFAGQCANPSQAAKIKDLPIWVFHGGKDPTVKLAVSEKMVNAIREAGGKNVMFTIYPDAGHDSWTATYDHPMLYTWLLAQKRPAKK